MNRLAIVGGRDFDNFPFLEKTLNDFNIPASIDMIVSGGAKGVDELAIQYANKYNIKSTIYKADWKTHGKSAGYIRNKIIWDNSDYIIAFWDGKSKGTKHTVDKFKGKDNFTLIMYQMQ